MIVRLLVLIYVDNAERDRESRGSAAKNAAKSRERMNWHMRSWSPVHAKVASLVALALRVEQFWRLSARRREGSRDRYTYGGRLLRIVSLPDGVCGNALNE